MGRAHGADEHAGGRAAEAAGSRGIHRRCREGGARSGYLEWALPRAADLPVVIDRTIRPKGGDVKVAAVVSRLGRHRICGAGRSDLQWPEPRAADLPEGVERVARALERHDEVAGAIQLDPGRRERGAGTGDL